MSDTVVCIRVRDGKPAVESAMTACGECGFAVWVSLVIVPKVKSQGMQIVCVHCLGDVLKREHDIVFGALDETLAEVVEVMRRRQQ